MSRRDATPIDLGMSDPTDRPDRLKRYSLKQHFLQEIDVSMSRSLLVHRASTQSPTSYAGFVSQNI